MKKIAAGLFCLLSMMQAIEIDVPFVKSQADANKHDVGNRLLLSKYYLQNHQYNLAEKYVKEILAFDASEPAAIKIKKQLAIIKALEAKSGLKNASASKSLHTFYRQNKYALMCEFYEKALKAGFSFDAKVDLEVADAYHKIGKDDKSVKLLSKHHYTDSKKIKNLKREIALSKAEKRLAEDGSALNNYLYLLKQEKSPKAFISTLQKYVKKNPQNIDAKIVLAENLYWKGYLKKAFHTLYPVRKHTNHSITLYTNILYVMRDYEHALYYLPDLAKKESDTKKRFDLEKKMAFSYLHVGKEEEANRLFKKLLKTHPDDKELRSYQEHYEKNQLLSQAISLHKAKDMENALLFYKRYYDKTHDPKIAKEIAEIYYFSKKEKLALPYFETYLVAYPEDTLLRFHYASALEKMKQYDKSVLEFRKIVRNPNAKEYYLAKYHYAYSLMHTFKDKDWLEARATLSTLVSQLQMRAKRDEESMLKFSRTLLKSAMGPIKKPTRYKDIVLTEGSYKIVNPKGLFSQEKIEFLSKPTPAELVRREESKKTSLWAGVEYVEDSAVSYTNYKIGVNNAFVRKDMQVGVEFQNYSFDGLYKDYDGMGLFINTKIDKWSVGVGLEHFDDFDTVVPRLSWSPSIGAHSLYMDAYYRNGAFVNYRNCMIQNETNVYHLGLYDTYLLDDLSTITAGLDINHFEDDNTNFYGQFTLPLYHDRGFGMEHDFLFNENIEYNTKSTVCSHPSEFYDSSYLKYQPKLRFKQGYIKGLLGVGYAFKNREAIFSYGLNGEYRAEDLVTFSLDCERLQSSFTAQEMTFCRLNMIQAW